MNACAKEIALIQIAGRGRVSTRRPKEDSTSYKGGWKTPTPCEQLPDQSIDMTFPPPDILRHPGCKRVHQGTMPPHKETLFHQKEYHRASARRLR